MGERAPLSRIAYVNGQYVPVAKAAVSIDDRAFTFGDGVYEVCRLNNGALIEEARHLARLRRSLAALRIPWPIGETGAADRHARDRDAQPVCVTVSSICRSAAAPRDAITDSLPRERSRAWSSRRERSTPAVGAARAATGVAVFTLPDQRWARPDIKTLQLLPNVLAKQLAREAGAFEAWFVDRAGIRHRRRFHQCLDRHCRWRPRHPAGGRGHPERRNPRRADRHCREARSLP